MKKFMKGCAIVALILLVLGFGMAIIAGRAEGMKTVREVVQSVTGGKVNINLDEGKDWGVFIGDNGWTEPEVLFDIDDNTMFDKDYDIINDNVDKYMVGSGVSKLDIEVGGCSFYFAKSGDENFYVEASNAGKFQCFIKNGTLYVKSSRTVVNDWDDINDGEIILYVPTEYKFDLIEVELGAGLLEIKDISTDKMNLEVGAGQITVDYLQADKCNIEVGMGEIIVEDMQVTKLDAEVGMGHLQIGGTILGEVDAECAMGSIEFDLAGREEDFNYNLKAAMGNVSIGGTEYSGLTGDRTVKNSASKNMNIECSMGNIVVDFED